MATTKIKTTQLDIATGTSAQVRMGDFSVQTANAALVGLGSVPNVDTTNASNISSGTLAAARLPATVQLTTDKGVANGYAELDSSGKVPQTQLPAVAITNTFVVASQAAMLALTAEEGDVAVRTDESKSYILTATPASTLANWQELLTPTDTVSSVFGRTGTVVSTNGDYTASQVTNVPAGDITAITVQAAITELDSEKVPTTRNIIAGTGLSGGGTLAADRTFSLDINSLTEETTIDSAADFLAIYDVSAGTLRKVKPSNLGISSTYTENRSALASFSGTTGTLPTATVPNLKVFKNGQLLEPTGDYSVAGTTLTLVEAAVTTDVYTIIYN